MPPIHRTHESDEEHSEAERQIILAGWLNVSMVAARLGRDASDTSALRLAGDVLATWAPSQQYYLCPPWQFDELGAPIPERVTLLSLLRSPEGLDIGLRSGGWGEVEWFIASHALLDGLSPAQVVVFETARFLAAARDEFSNPRDSR